MTDGRRTLVLGFDALDFEYLDRFEDATPTLSRLCTDGVTAPLDSTDPPWTASAWPSMYTGTGPSYHGVYGFFTYDYPDDAQLVTRNDVDAPALWNYCSAQSLGSIVLNVPVTHPAEPVDGVLLPGYLGSEDDAGHPAGIRDDLSAALGEEYRIYSRAELADDPAAKLEGYLDLVDLRKRAAVELLTDREWELGVVQVQKTDSVFHNFDDDAALRAVYEAADEFAADVLEAVDEPVDVVVCSDHGMGRKEGYQIQINDVLRREGYVEATSDDASVSLADEKPGMVAADGTSDPAADSSSVVADGVATAERVLSRFGVTPGRVYGLAEAVGADGFLLDVIPDSIRRSAGECVDWRNSDAYCRGASRLGVRINLEGRDPEGTVPEDEYESVREDLMDLLADLETPDGEPAFERILPREAVYDGPHVDDAPDLVVRPRDGDHVLSTDLYGREFVPAGVHDHEPTGVFVGHGPGFDHDADPGRLSLTDVAPVVMALLGQPVPERMTGSVPPGLLSVPARREDYGDVSFGTDHAVEDAREEVSDALADLGYI